MSNHQPGFALTAKALHYLAPHPAPARFPFRDHRTVAEVGQVEG